MQSIYNSSAWWALRLC